MSIDTQYVGGKIQLTFTFDAQDDGLDMAFAKSASRAVRDAIHADGTAEDYPGRKNALQCLNNAFNAVLLCGSAHVDATAAVEYANGGKE